MVLHRGPDLRLGSALIGRWSRPRQRRGFLSQCALTASLPGERYLQRLCDRSFLSLWSYPSTFRDQKASGKGDGKELCDLLVVFGDDVLIFSDKSCSFPETGDTHLDWSRWFRRAVMKSAEQVWGAERWLRDDPNRTFLDRACTQPFPLEIPPAHRTRVHRIVVAHNVADRCAAFFPVVAVR